MLHGEIKVNDGEIGRWKAVRKEECGLDKTNPMYRYECYLWYRNTAGYPMEAAFEVRHTAKEGALVLAQRVLLQGMGQLRVRPMDAADVMSERLS